MRIIGIDPGLANVGITVIDTEQPLGERTLHVECYTTDSTHHEAVRVSYTVKYLAHIIRHYRITHLAIEQFYSRRVTQRYIAALIVCVEMMCHELKIPYTLVNPQRVKSYKAEHHKAIGEIQERNRLTMHEIDATCVAEIALVEMEAKRLGLMKE